MHTARPDMQEAKNSQLCFPTVTASNPVSLLLSAHLMENGLRQAHCILKPSLVSVKYAVVYTAGYVFIFAQECHLIHTKALLSYLTDP